MVERVNILGNTVTEESVIRSELLLDEGDPYNKLKLEKSIAQIKSRNLFSKVEKNIISGPSEAWTAFDQRTSGASDTVLSPHLGRSWYKHLDKTRQTYRKYTLSGHP